MCISANIGIDILLNYTQIDYNSFFYNENPGIVIEIEEENMNYIIDNLYFNNINFFILGKTNTTKRLNITYNSKNILNECIEKLRYQWQKRSYDMELLQADKGCIQDEIKNCYNRKIPKFVIPDNLFKMIDYPFSLFSYKPKVAILNEEGSNGENEMAYCFYEVGFDVYNININGK